VGSGEGEGKPLPNYVHHSKKYIVYASELSIMFDVYMDQIVMIAIAYMNVLHSRRRSDQLSNGILILTNSVVIYVNAD
jgi:hypothetical protein